jgi:hypothetical protein
MMPSQSNNHHLPYLTAGPAFEYKDYENAIDGTVYLQDGE